MDWVLNTGTRATLAGFRARRQLADHAIRADGTTRPLSAFRAERPLVLAGIARPEVFFDMLTAAGVQPGHRWALPDHESFDDIELPSDDGCSLICTEKDAVKLWRHRPDAWAVPLNLELDPELLVALDTALDRLFTAGPRR